MFAPSVVTEVCASQSEDSRVSLNIYELNPMFELLNQLVLRKNQMGIFHCGVEIYHVEFSFVFSTSSDETGVRQYIPKQSTNYKFRESIHIGWTDLSVERTNYIVSSLAPEWPARSYHITRRNCLHFSEALIDALGFRQQFPQWLKSVSEIAMKSPGTASAVDHFWRWGKWCTAADRELHDYRLFKCCAAGNDATMCGVCRDYLTIDESPKCCAENRDEMEQCIREPDTTLLARRRLCFSV